MNTLPDAICSLGEHVKHFRLNEAGEERRRGGCPASPAGLLSRVTGMSRQTLNDIVRGVCKSPNYPTRLLLAILIVLKGRPDLEELLAEAVAQVEAWESNSEPSASS